MRKWCWTLRSPLPAADESRHLKQDGFRGFWCLILPPQMCHTVLGNFSHPFMLLFSKAFYAWAFFFFSKEWDFVKRIAIFGEITGAPLACSYKTAWFRSLVLSADGKWCRVVCGWMWRYIFTSLVSRIASLLCADSYLLTAGPQTASYSFLLINEKIQIVQHIKDFLASFPAWVLSALLLGLVEAGVKCMSTAAHSCICVSLVGPCRPVS